jgi:LPS sulfotransferase NodH
VRFAILFPGRTGSSFLVSSLASHPGILVEGERLVRRPGWWQRRWIRRLYDRRRDPAIAAVGFKTKLKDVWNLDAFAAMLRARGVRIIELRRRNPVKLAVSTINARRLREQSGRWNRTGETRPLGPLAVEPADLERMVATCMARQAELAAYVGALELPTLRLDYEELLTDRDRWLARVLAFLKVSDMPLRSELLKATDDDLRRALRDYDAVAKHFAGGSYAAFFSADA